MIFYLSRRFEPAREGGDDMTRKMIAGGLALFLLAGCASVEESNVYSPEDMNKLENYKLVKVVHAEQVKIDPETPGIVGGGIGAASGGLIGSQVGGDSAIVALAVLGGLIGYAVEQQATDTTATRYVVDVDGKQQVIIQKESDAPLAPGDMAMMIGDYKPRLVKAPQEIIDSAQQNGAASKVRVNQETGEFLFDDELTPASAPGGAAGGDQTQPASQQGQQGGSWVEPKAGDWSEPASQQQ
jgi:outer membrane lipoprotein SlyB